MCPPPSIYMTSGLNKCERLKGVSVNEARARANCWMVEELAGVKTT